MAFFSKIFSTASPVTGKFSTSGSSKTVKKIVPMRKLAVRHVDEKEANPITERSQSKTAQEHRKTEVLKVTELTQKKTEETQNDRVAVKKESNINPNDPLLKLKSSAEQIRHRVHYIDKNDFAKRAISSKDKVYDFDLRKDLAYFLANDEFLMEVEEGISVDKNEEDFQKFERLILKAADNKTIDYVVYGERTYIIEMASEENVPTQRTARNPKQAENSAVSNKVAGLSMEVVEVFRKNAAEFVENLKKEAQAEADNLITPAEQNVLLKIFTKKFLREMIAEKEKVMKEKMSFDCQRSEDLVEFVCEAIFK